MTVNKRKYQKPAMQVYELPCRQQLLVESNGGGLHDYNRPTPPYEW